MKHVFHKPVNPDVSQIVKCIGYVEMEKSDPISGWFGLFPNASSNLTISLDHRAPISYHNTSEKAVVYASWNSPVALKQTRSLRFVHVVFKAFGLRCITGIPMTELHNTVLTLDDIVSPRLNHGLLDRLYDSTTPENLFIEVERFISDRIDRKFIDPRVQMATALINQAGSPELDDVCRAVCLSPRRFRELFMEDTGFSPGFFKKTLRFHKAYRQMEENDRVSLTEIAYAHNYYDQSHFIKDFKFFAGITPTQYLKQKAAPADFYNFTIPDLQKFVPGA